MLSANSRVACSKAYQVWRIDRETIGYLAPALLIAGGVVTKIQGGCCRRPIIPKAELNEESFETK